MIDLYVSDLQSIDACFNNEIAHENTVDVRSVDTVGIGLVNSFLAAMKANDWTLMRSIMAGDLIWTLPGNSLLSGPANGVDAVIRRASSLKKFGVMFQLRGILYGLDGAALSLHNTASRDSLILDEYVTIVFGFADSLIVEMITHLSDVPGIEAFFISGIIS
jgi:hypothetical protein